MATAASRVSSSDDAMSSASAPSAAPSGESVSVEKNSAIAATPSIDSGDVADDQHRPRPPAPTG